MPSVLVTGASGFVGAHVSDVMARAGWTVLAGVRASSDLWRLERLGCTAGRVALDLAGDAAEIERALADSRPDLLIHCGAHYGRDRLHQDVTTAVQTNFQGTIHLIRAAARVGVGRAIHVGTCYEYGPVDGPIDESVPIAPRSLYSITKAAATMAALGTAAVHGLPLAAVRLFNVYGPLEGDTKFVSSVLRACRHGQRTELTPGGQVRDYTYVRDIAEAFRRLGERTPFPAGEIVNLGSGLPVTIRALGDAAAAVVGHGGEHLVWGALPYRSDEVRSIVADSGKAAALLGWRATTPLADGLRATLDELEKA